MAILIASMQHAPNIPGHHPLAIECHPCLLRVQSERDLFRSARSRLLRPSRRGTAKYSDHRRELLITDEDTCLPLRAPALAVFSKPFKAACASGIAVWGITAGKWANRHAPRQKAGLASARATRMTPRAHDQRRRFPRGHQSVGQCCTAVPSVCVVLGSPTRLIITRIRSQLAVARLAAFA